MNDLLKAFDIPTYDPLIAYLHVYGFSKESLKLVFYYLFDRWKRANICGSFSFWVDFPQGEGSVLELLNFNIY